MDNFVLKNGLFLLHAVKKDFENHYFAKLAVQIESQYKLENSLGFHIHFQLYQVPR